MQGDIPYVKIHPRTKRLGMTVVHVAHTPSTMQLARERAIAGAGEGLVVVADHQTAGVGRRGRTWTSLGTSLNSTLLLRPPVPAARLSLVPFAAGLAAADAARKLLRIELRLKWPNDLIYGIRKVGGVLIDTVYTNGDNPDFMLLGLGVNGDVRIEEFPAELKLTATSLSDAAGRHVCMPAFLKLFLEAFEPRYDALLAGRPDEVWKETKTKLGTLGKKVRVHVASGVVEGDAVDLGPDGELFVRSEGVLHAVRSGECEELRLV